MHPRIASARATARSSPSALIAGLRERSFHTPLGGIALPNEASIALHEKFGYEKVAHLKEVGWKFSR